jgi:DNA-3-methyladenine glycosylase
VKLLDIPRVDAEFVEHVSIALRFHQLGVNVVGINETTSTGSVVTAFREGVSRRNELYDRDSLAARRLPRSWYAGDALALARALIGCLLVHERGETAELCISRIVETEAYCGASDLACHARAGLTKRTRALLGEEGHAYVFFVYGMHDCFNVTCRGAGSGHAVLIRAGEPTCGFAPGARLDGPGRLTRSMGITRAHDGEDLTRGGLYVCSRTGRSPRIGVTARVGVGYAGEWADRPWRFLDADSRHVSRPPKSAIGRRVDG